MMNKSIEQHHASNVLLDQPTGGQGSNEEKKSPDQSSKSLKFVKQNESLKTVKPLPEDLALEDGAHRDGLRLEPGGQLNKKVHAEMFLGGLHEEFLSKSLDQAKWTLKEIVKKVDLDQNGLLTASEMESWLQAKINEHIEEAKNDTDRIFKHLDPDHDGRVDWKDFYMHFLLSRGYDERKSRSHVRDYDDGVKLSQEDKDAIVVYKFRWTDADTSPVDNKLDVTEFMSFRHPEHNGKTLESMTRNIFKSLDSNRDGDISEDEFAALPPGEVENEEFAAMDRKYQEERKQEFRKYVDADNDGKANLRELRQYLDPTGPGAAALEAKRLLEMMDDDRDGTLSMKEINIHAETFKTSQLMNYAANLHDEF